MHYRPKTHQHYESDLDWEVKRTYQLIAQGKVIIQAIDAIKRAGLDALGLPTKPIIERPDMQYRIEFQRIGRNRSVPPLEVKALGEADLCRAIRDYARPHLLSRNFDVILDEDTDRGWLACGMHNGGDFVVHPL